MAHRLKVMKFGGTSMGDAVCIKRATDIVCEAAKDGALVVVVSAMGGVTNRLVAAAHSSLKGEMKAGEMLEADLRQQHFERD